MGNSKTKEMAWIMTLYFFTIIFAILLCESKLSRELEEIKEQIQEVRESCGGNHDG